MAAGGNRDAIGTRSRLTWDAGRRSATSGRARAISQNDLRAHFGLGEASRAEGIDILWSSGWTETLRDVAARQIVTVGEGRGILRDAVRWLTLLALRYRLLTERQFCPGADAASFRAVTHDKHLGVGLSELS